MSGKYKMKKKLAGFSALICSLAVVSTVPYSRNCRPVIPYAAEEDVSPEQPFPFLRYFWSYQNWDDSYCITIEECDKDYTGNLIVPEYIDGCKVAKISAEAFRGCVNLTGIALPETVENIGERAFADCFSLKTVIIRNDMCYFPDDGELFSGNEHFYPDSPVRGIIYGAEQSTAYEYARSYGLDFSADIPELETSPESILPYLTYEIQNSAVIIKKCDVSAAGKYMIPAYIENLPVAEIAEGAFENCSGITEIEIPDTIPVILPRTFSGCSGLRRIDLPETVRLVEQEAFARCSSLENVIIRNAECEIYSDPLTICNSAEPFEYTNERFFGTIYAPAGSRAEEYAAMNNCDFSSGMPENQIYAENAVPYLTYEEIGDADIRITKCSPDASGRLIVPLSIDGKIVSEIGQEAFMDCKDITDIELPPSVSMIGQDAFRRCTSLRKIDLNRRLFVIGRNAFAECPGLETVIIRNERCDIDPNPDTFSGINTPFGGTIYGVADSTAQEYAEDNSYNFSAEIPDCTHYSADNSSYLTFENDGYGAILTKCDPSAAGKLVIPKVVNGMPVTEIGENAFDDCTNLTSVVLPERVRFLPSEAFAENWSLCEAELPGNMLFLPAGAFRKCINLKKIAFPERIEYIAENCFEDCWSLESITVPEQVNTIMTGAFSGCESLKNVILPENLNDIGSHAFSGCVSLETIELPENLSFLGYSAFSDCSQLKSVNIPSELDMIEGSAFERTGIGSVDIPESVLTISIHAFYSCENLEKVTILNPYCKIYDSAETICNTQRSTEGAVFNGIICGYDGSTAEKYAEKYGYVFESLGDAPEGVRGDANADGKLDIADAVMLEKWLIGSGDLTAPKNADLCEDGVIDAFDMCLLRKELVAGAD